MNQLKTVVSLNIGDKYHPDYVRNMDAAVKRHSDAKFVCFTDQAVEGIDCRHAKFKGTSISHWTLEIPEQHYCWFKLLFFGRLDDIEYPILFTDIDNIIIDDLHKLEVDADFCLIRQRKNIVSAGTYPLYSSSVMWFFEPWVRRGPLNDFRWPYADIFFGDQDWIGWQIRSDAYVWPDKYFEYLDRARAPDPPQGAVVVMGCKHKPHGLAAKRDYRYDWIRREWGPSIQDASLGSKI